MTAIAKVGVELTLDDGKILDRQALHSYYLEFTHPVSGKKLCFSSAPDFISQEEFRDVLKNTVKD